MITTPASEMRTCFHLVFISLVISVTIQILWPRIQQFASHQNLCQYDILPEVVKQSLPCYLTSKRRALTRRTSDVAYFVEPYSLEPWSDGNGKPIRDENIPFSMPFRITEKKEALAEAVAALKAAVSSRKSGKMQKAETIIKHALALAPDHPDILTEYGILVETVRQNVVEAEELYTRALNYNPHHKEALIARARTLPLVEEIDNKMLEALRRKRDYFLRIPRSSAALKRAMRESYFLHIYHTVALEGNTMTPVQTRSILETRMAVAGKSIMEHNEILGMDAALRFLNQSLVHIGYISVEDILEIHRRVLGYVDPEAAGVFRLTQVFVGSFTPVAPELVNGEMEEMIRWLNDDETLLLDPVEFAAIAHYKLVYIHPFVDGNGRTARLLMNLILMQNGFPPVIIPVEERGEYYRTLNVANSGDLRPFIRFITRQTDNTLQSYINAAFMCDVHDTEADCAAAKARELPDKLSSSSH